MNNTLSKIKTSDKLCIVIKLKIRIFDVYKYIFYRNSFLQFNFSPQSLIR